MDLKRGTRSSNRRKPQARAKGRTAARGTAQRSGWRLWLRRAVMVGGALAALALLALLTSVFFAARNMPGYATLMNSQVVQTIVVRSSDGS